MNLLDHIKGLASAADTDFVTAGCTLDAAGKIYSCRVDSVHNETFRVVHGLGRVGDGQEEEGAAEAEEGEGGGSESGDEGEAAKKVKKTTARSSTIENNPDALLQKKVETESNVDPLFQKMCKAFDEGGARGVLLNQLALAPGCSLLIESTAVVDDANPHAPSRVAGAGQPVDVSALKADVLASVGAASDEAFEKTLLAASLCPTVLDFLGIGGQGEDDDAVGDVCVGPKDLAQLDPVECLPPACAPARCSSGGAGDVEAGGDAGEDVCGGDHDDDDDDDGGGGCDEGAVDMEEQMRKEICEEAMPEGGAGVPLRGKSRARQSLTGDLDQLDMLIGGGAHDDYTYFSREAVRGWAGPAHWSFRKGPPKVQVLARAGGGGGEGEGEAGEGGAVREFGNTYAAKGRGGSGKGGKKKEAFFLDLAGAEPADMAKKMSKSKTSITLAVVKGAKESELNTLPEDLRYYSYICIDIDRDR